MPQKAILQIMKTVYKSKNKIGYVKGQQQRQWSWGSKLTQQAPRTTSLEFIAQLTFTCSKSTIETLGKGLKSVPNPEYIWGYRLFVLL